MNLKKAKILVVDDEKMNIDLLVGILSDTYQILVARNGPDALKRAHTAPQPDLILLDVMMPDMDGYETCRKLKSDEETKDIPIIFVTVKDAEEDETRGFTLGAVDYIRKPISPEILKVRIKTHLSLYEINQKLAMLNQASQLFNSALDWQQVLKSVLGEMHQLMNIMATSFWLIDPETGELACQHATGPGNEKIIDWRLTHGTGIVSRSARTGEIINVDDVFSNEYHFDEVCKTAGIEPCSMLSIPFKMKGKVIGVLQLLDEAKGRFTEDVIQFVEPIVGAAASAIENSRLYMKAQEQKEAAIKARNRLQAELNEALNYVKALLPAPINENRIRVDWRFLPCSVLGGDSFGYHWIDDRHFAMYLVDVAGHGVGAALLSVSVMNTLSSQVLQDIDFREPRQVLEELNEIFPCEKHNGMFFTIWYGVYNKSSGKLMYCSGGHPAAILLTDAAGKKREEKHLFTKNIVIGAVPQCHFIQKDVTIQLPASLYIFSDGVFEIEKKEGIYWQFEEFVDLLTNLSQDRSAVLDNLISYTKELNCSPDFKDDYTILEIEFE